MRIPVPRMAWSGLWVVLAASTAWGRPSGTSAAAVDSNAAPPTHAAPDPWASAEITPPSDVAPPTEARPLPRRSALRPGDSAPRPGTRQASAWLRTSASLGGVVALILLLAWGYRRVAAGWGILPRDLRPRRAPLIEVVSRAALAPRQTLYLIRVGPRLILVGCTPDAIRPLHEIQDPDLVATLLGEAAGQRPDSASAEFARCLEQQASAFEADSPNTTEKLTPDEQGLGTVRKKLEDTIARLRRSGAASG